MVMKIVCELCTNRVSVCVLIILAELALMQVR